MLVRREQWGTQRPMAENDGVITDARLTHHLNALAALHFRRRRMAGNHRGRRTTLNPSATSGSSGRIGRRGSRQRLRYAAHDRGPPVLVAERLATCRG
jgi:hypothetical protein